MNGRGLGGSVRAIPSKSQAHRLLICAALADKPGKIRCPAVNEDIIATARCLSSLGAKIERSGDSFHVQHLAVTVSEVSAHRAKSITVKQCDSTLECAQ